MASTAGWSAELRAAENGIRLLDIAAVECKARRRQERAREVALAEAAADFASRERARLALEKRQAAKLRGPLDLPTRARSESGESRTTLKMESAGAHERELWNDDFELSTSINDTEGGANSRPGDVGLGSSGVSLCGSCGGVDPFFDYSLAIAKRQQENSTLSLSVLSAEDAVREAQLLGVKQTCLSDVLKIKVKSKQLTVKSGEAHQDVLKSSYGDNKKIIANVRGLDYAEHQKELENARRTEEFSKMSHSADIPDWVRVRLAASGAL